MYPALLVLLLPLTVAHAQTPATYPLQDGFVDAHGVLIYYQTLGQGAPLLIVHGGPGASHDYFLPYLLPLARHHKLIFIDERGSGKSEKLDDPSGYTVENMVEDTEAVRQGTQAGPHQPAGPLVWRRAGAGLCAQVSGQSHALDSVQHLLQHQ
jgi:pimeloyl-ACP methyl ester carboxylesterase